MWFDGLGAPSFQKTTWPTKHFGIPLNTSTNTIDFKPERRSRTRAKLEDPGTSKSWHKRRDGNFCSAAPSNGKLVVCSVVFGCVEKKVVCPSMTRGRGHHGQQKKLGPPAHPGTRIYLEAGYTTLKYDMRNATGHASERDRKVLIVWAPLGPVGRQIH